MHTVTSSYKRRESLTLGDMKVGDYVLTYGTCCLVTAGGEHGVVTKALADGSEIFRQTTEVERVPPGTVITIVVGGEEPEISGNPWIKKRHESVLQNPGPQSDAEFNAADVLMQFICLHLYVDQQSESNEDVEIFCNEFGLEQPHEDWEDRLTAARKREEETENRQLTDAEFLDSLRDAGTIFSIGIGETTANYIARLSLGERKLRRQANTFHEAVQWLREEVDG